jgi:hypothetical protein
MERKKKGMHGKKSSKKKRPKKNTKGEKKRTK